MAIYEGTSVGGGREEAQLVAISGDICRRRQAPVIVLRSFAFFVWWYSFYLYLGVRSTGSAFVAGQSEGAGASVKVYAGSTMVGSGGAVHIGAGVGERGGVLQLRGGEALSNTGGHVDLASSRGQAMFSTGVVRVASPSIDSGSSGTVSNL